MSLSDLLQPRHSPARQPARECARAYVRVSHERSAEKAISPETQRRRIESYARGQGYEIIEWYTDLARSAFHDDDRPEFDRMLRDAQADPSTSVILVFRYDRFSRSWAAPGQQQALLRAGVRIESAEEGYYDPDSETGAIMMPLTWSLNRLFSIKLRNVTIPNMKTNFEQRDPETGWAYKNGGHAQWGYKPHRIPIGRNRHGHDLHKLIWLLDDTQVAGKPVHEWARTMLVEWRLGEKVGYDRIAERLTKLHIPTPLGRSAWSMSSIQSLIGDWPRLYQYAGYAFWNREDCTDKGKRRQRDPSEWIVVPNAHPAIITEAEADAIWGIVSEQKRATHGRTAEMSRWALSGGFLKCGHCGANFAGSVVRGRDYYVCGSHLYRRGGDCVKPAWYIPREDIEATLLRRITKLLAKHAGDLSEWIAEANDAAQEEWRVIQKTVKERARRIAQRERELVNLADAMAQAGPTPELVERTREARADIERLQRIDRIEQPPRIDAAAIEALAARVESASQDSEARRMLIQQFRPEIIADPVKRQLEGQIDDPRSLLANDMAAPTGVEPVLRP